MDDEQTGYAALLDCESTGPRDSVVPRHSESRNTFWAYIKRRPIAVSATAVVVIAAVVTVAVVTTVGGNSPPPLCDQSQITCGQTGASQATQSLQEAVESDSPNGSEIWGVAYSGGGWRAQAASIGFAKALYERGITQQLAAVSSVSGGSWFSSQYTFSQDFQDAVHSEQPRELYIKWLKGYFTIVQPSTAFQETISKVAEYFGPQLGGYYSQLLEGAVNHAFTWELFVTAMLETFTEGMGEKSATQENRATGTSYDVLFCTSIASKSQMTGIAEDMSNIRLGSDPVQPLYPAAWLLGSDGDGTWKIPHSLSKMTVELAASMSSWWSPPPAEPAVLDTPSIGKVASMSSAAAGLLGAPQLLHRAISYYFTQDGNTIASTLKTKMAMATVEAAPWQGMAVCSNNVSECAYPDVRLLDGGYTDDSGIALLISRLQAKYGAKTPLRIAALDSNQCDYGSGDDLKTACTASVSYESELLFITSGTQASEVDEQMFTSNLQRNTAIFDADWGTTELGLDASKPGNHNMTYHVGTYTTIQNTLFGVQAGTRVTLMVFNINTNLPTVLVDQGSNTTGAYGDLAQQTYEVASDALEEFFSQ